MSTPESITWGKPGPSSVLTTGWVIAIAGVQVFAGLSAVLYGWPLALAPIAVAATLLAAAFPRAGLIVLMLAMFSKHSLPGLNGIYASDVVSIPVLAGAAIRFLSRQEARWTRSPLLAPMVAITIYFGTTVLWALHPMPALINWLRHVQLIALCLLMVEIIEVEDIPRIVTVMAITTIVVSCFVMGEFVSTGGRARVFGPAGWFFNTFLALSMVHAAVGAILSPRSLTRLLWIAGAVICFLGLIATQTRSAMLQALIGIACATFCAWRWAGWNRSPGIRRRIMILVAVTTAMIVVFMFGKILLFETASGRVTQALEGRSNTIFIRILLWKMGWTVFADSPVFGVGLGQASRWSEQINYFHLDPASPHAGGLGVHNDAITYLAETGIVGTSLIMWLFAALARMGWRLLRSLRSGREAYLLIAVLAPVGAVIAHYFYSAYLFYSIGGMVVAFYFAMLTKLYIAWKPSGQPTRSLST